MRLAGIKGLHFSLLAAMVHWCKSKSAPPNSETQVEQNCSEMHFESKQVKRKKQSANKKTQNHFNSYFCSRFVSQSE